MPSTALVWRTPPPESRDATSEWLRKRVAWLEEMEGKYGPMLNRKAAVDPSGTAYVLAQYPWGCSTFSTLSNMADYPMSPDSSEVQPLFPHTTSENLSQHEVPIAKTFTNHRKIAPRRVPGVRSPTPLAKR